MNLILMTTPILAFWQNNSLLAATCFLFVAAIGSLLRWGFQLWGSSRQWLGTLSVNLSSSFLLGLLLASDFHPTTVTILGGGFLGSLSTFSTVIMQTADESSNGNRFTAYAYLLMTIGLGVLLAFIGLEIGNR